MSEYKSYLEMDVSRMSDKLIDFIENLPDDFPKKELVSLIVDNLDDVFDDGKDFERTSEWY